LQFQIPLLPLSLPWYGKSKERKEEKKRIRTAERIVEELVLRLRAPNQI